MKENDTHLKTFYSGSLISIAGAGISGVLNYFIRRTLSLNLTEIDYGTFYSTIAFLCMVGGFAELGLSQAGALLVAEHNTGPHPLQKVSACFSAILSLKLMLALLVLLVLLYGSSWIRAGYLRTDYALFYYLLLGMLFCQILESAFYPLFSGLKHFTAYNLLLVLKALLLLIGTLAVSCSGGLSGTALVFFTVSAAILCIASSMAFFREKIRLNWNIARGTWKRLFHLSGFVAVSTTLLNMMYYMDTVMLTSICGVTSSAMYNIALPIMQIVQAAMIFPLIILPVAVQMNREKRYAQLKRISSWAVITALSLLPVILLFFHLSSPTLIRLLFSGKYLAAAPAVTILCGGLVFYTLGNFLMQIALTMDGAKQMAVATFITALCNFSLNWLLIPRHDFIGAATATACSYLIFSISAMVVLRHRIAQKQKEQK